MNSLHHSSMRRLVSSGWGLVVLLAAASGCGKAATPEQSTVAPSQSARTDARPTPVARNDRGTSDSGCQLGAVYFDFDSDNLDAKSREALNQYAKCLREKKPTEVRVTGRTDPRGTEEYNLALGDRRARAVEGYLGTLGVEKSALRAHSVGEEYATGEDESGWAKDRRADVDAP